MNEHTAMPRSESASWLYEGIWGVLTQMFCVPREAPVLPALDGEEVVSRKPSENFVRYLKFQYRITIALIASITIGGSVILAIIEDPWFWVATVLISIAFIVACIIAYLVIHLRYDTMWYVFTDRSMRLRRGIWLIRESTITFENIQNVKVTQGPLQRWFDIADVVVETAGGGGQSEHGGHGMHAGVIEGIADAGKIRDSIMSRVQASRSIGLGDDDTGNPRQGTRWSDRELEVLRELCHLAQRSASLPS